MRWFPRNLNNTHKFHNQDSFINFAAAEAKLEIFLEENFASNASANHSTLVDITKELLKSMKDERGRTEHFLDGSLLLAKINYIQGNFVEAYKNAKEGDVLKGDTKSLSCRSLKIAAEAFAVAGLVLDKGVIQTSTAEKDECVIHYLSLATNLALLYSQELDKEIKPISLHPILSGPNVSTGPALNHNLGSIIETAMLKCASCLLRLGYRVEAINHYRLILNSLESSLSQSIRFAAARQLAELLLRDMSECIYKPPPVIPECVKNGKVVKYVGIGQIPVAAGAEGPRKPLRYCGNNVNIPKDLNEEILLLLMMCEAQAARDAVLSQAPECAATKRQLFETATSIYDLLTVFFMYNDQKAMICETLERALKFSFGEPYVWSQLASSLVSIGRYTKAIGALKEATRLCPDMTLCLMAARICLENLNMIDEGLIWAEKALDMEREQPQGMGLESRAHLYIGIAHLLKARQQRLKEERKASTAMASQAFTSARNCDPGDHLPYFYLAVVEAEQGYIPQAMVTVRRAVRLRAMHLPSLILMALLHSVPEGHGGGDLEDGLITPAYGNLEMTESLVDTILEEYPDCFEALFLKAKLDEVISGPEDGIMVARRMTTLWKRLYDEQVVTNDNSVSHHVLETRSLASQYFTKDLSDIDAGSIHASKVEQAMSDFGSNGSSAYIRTIPHKSWSLQLKILLCTVELYLKQGMIQDAEACLAEAEAVAPVSFQVAYMRGLVREHKNELIEAKQNYSDAISINPYHLPSLQRLGLVTHFLGSHHLAEKVLRDALMVEPMAYKTWYYLGEVLEAERDFEEAAKCMTTAIDVQRTSPILDFGIVPLIFE
ncbi:tetratricopeptide repeat protein 7B-like isoform X2 [Artemia franciscana]|uniref:tetratricopeptide repeat protein 7B-like isoform X2 n=1 Tax=Artemia franciscana TaxID=6661 RepID=UPI0032DB659B